MFRVSKLRTAVAILAATSSVAAATGPIVSTASAADNGGDKPLSHDALCESLHNSYNDLLLIAVVNRDEGNHSTFIKAQVDAASVRNAAYKEGCKWATGRVVAKKPGIGGAVQTTTRPSAR